MQSFFIAIFAALLLGGCGGGSTSSAEETATTYTVGGTVNVGTQMAIDGDTKETRNLYVDNDGATLAQTQAVDNPATIGGYLGIIGSKTDSVDAYKVDMLAGQQLTLVVADPAANDFDLYLYDANGTMVSNSQGVEQYEVLDIPADGTYYVAVYGYSVVSLGDTGGLYNLMIGQGSASVSHAVLQKTRLSDRLPMAEGEVIFAQNASARSAADAWKSDLQQAGFGIRAVSGTNGVSRLVLETPALAAARTSAALAPTVSETVRAVKRLRRRGDIAYAEPNYVLKAAAVPNDRYYPLQWHYPLIDLPEAWDITTGSRSVIVAVIDTGVVLTHPDLTAQLIAGYDFIADVQMSNDGDGIDPDPNDPGDGDSEAESSFHGTHVAGTVGASTNNSIGVAGVAWQCRIMPVRALGKGGGTMYDIAQGIRYAAGLSNDSGTVPAQKADIINMSLGGEGYSQTMQDAINAAYTQGVIIVAAAGNDNADAMGYSPAGLDNVITVSAVDYNTQKAPYSNYGSVVDVAAPGGNLAADGNADGYGDGVLSTVSDNTYKFYQGTSMAAPHVAGVIALMKSVDAGLTQEDFLRLLARNHPETTQAITVDKGVSGRDDDYGYGLINALGAVKAAQALADTPVSPLPVLSALPESFAFNNLSTTGTLYLGNAGSGTLEITGVVSSQPWLTVTATGTAGEYTVSAATAGLGTGVYNAAIAVTSNGGDLDIPVLLTLTESVKTQGDVGAVYVLLIDAATYATKAEYVTSGSAQYAYSFSGVSKGSYYLVAGTDIDGDYYIDNAGEAVGIYPTFSQPRMLTVDRNLAALDLTVSYQTPLQTLKSFLASDTSDETVRLKRGNI